MFRGTALLEALEPRVQFSHPTFTVSFNDPGGAHSAYYNDLRNTIVADGADWAQYFTSSAQIGVEIDFSSADIRATGSSTSQRYLRQDGSLGVYQAGAAAKLTSGIDVNGSAPDIIITVGDSYLSNELWFDPDPVHRTALVPANRTDATSVFLHELGHGLGIIGYRDGTTGLISGSAETTYDLFTMLAGSNIFFTGSTATTWYGQGVPLTSGNISHVGNYAPQPGSDLLNDLMNGVVFNRGTRYHISGLDLAILQDTGLPSTLNPWSTITGQVFFDSNHDGIANRHEPRLAGWRVYADLNGNGIPDAGEPSVVTNSLGVYNFAGLHPGRYVIRAYGKKRWTLTSPKGGSILVKTQTSSFTAVASFGLYCPTVSPASLTTIAAATPTAGVLSTLTASIPPSQTMFSPTHSLLTSIENDSPGGQVLYTLDAVLKSTSTSGIASA